jgi:predicted outer membrane repeat protein
MATADLLIDGVQFDSNSASSNGGAIATSSTGTIVVRDATFLNQFAAQGGAIFASGATQVEIHASRFSGNSASSQGGAIRVENLLLRDSRVEDNTLFGGGSSGGGIYVAQVGTISNSVIKGNSAGNGGGVHAAVLLIEDSLLELNSASADGGAAHVVDHADLLRVRSRANLASGSGAGIYLAAGGILPSQIRQSLFDGNTANALGGGLWLGGEASMGNTTITLNGANAGGGGIYIAASANLAATNISLVENPTGRDLHKFGDLSLQNSIISTADEPNCLTDAGNPLIVSLGNNISDDLSCSGLSHPSDQTGTDPLLEALANNGGNTLTYAPTPLSPAVDAGNDAACAAQPVGGLDQRGAPRPAGVVCDIGAHEVDAELPIELFSDGFEAN